MNNPNPFVPKGSLLEQQNKRRTHMKLGVFCVLAVSVAGLMAMLIQGCTQKKEEPPVSMDTNTFPVPDTNTPPTDISNTAPVTPSTNVSMAPSPISTQAAPLPVPAPAPAPTPMTAPLPPMTPETGGTEYVVKKGDTLGKIAKKNGVTVKALETANPSVKPTKMKAGQKLVIPAGGKTAADATTATGVSATSETGVQTYTVKSGDNLQKIATAHHVKVKVLQAANHLTTTKIKVGQKLKIPSKAEAPVAAPMVETMSAPTSAAPAVEPMPAPPVPVVSPSPAPVQH